MSCKNLITHCTSKFVHFFMVFAIFVVASYMFVLNIKCVLRTITYSCLFLCVYNSHTVWILIDLYLSVSYFLFGHLFSFFFLFLSMIMLITSSLCHVTSVPLPASSLELHIEFFWMRWISPSLPLYGSCFRNSKFIIFFFLNIVSYMLDLLIKWFEHSIWYSLSIDLIL